MTKEDRKSKPAIVGGKSGALTRWLSKESKRSRGASIIVVSKLEEPKEWNCRGVKKKIKKPNPRRWIEGWEEKSKESKGCKKIT